MENNLTFLRTISADQFKAEQRITEIEVLENPKTGKCFFAFAGKKGACSQRASEGTLTIPMVSEVCNEDTGEEFLLLHQKGEGAKLLAVL